MKTFQRQLTGHLSVRLFPLSRLISTYKTLGRVTLGQLKKKLGRVVLDHGASCLGPSFNRGELAWGELSLVRVVLISKERNTRRAARMFFFSFKN